MQLAKTMGIEELPPICRTPRLEELEAEGQATTAEILRRADIPLGMNHDDSDDDFRPLSARSVPNDSQSIMHDMVELPFQDSRQDALHPGAMTPGAQKIAAAAAQSETPASRRLNLNSRFGGSGALETSVMEGLDGAIYLSPSESSGMAVGAGPSNTQQSQEPHMVLEMEEAATFSSLRSAGSQQQSQGVTARGPTSAAMQPVEAPSHADENAGQTYSSGRPLPDSDLSSPGDNLLGQRPTEAHPTVMASDGGVRQPQPMLKTEAQFGPPSAASSPSDSAPGRGDDPGLVAASRHSTASKNQKLHTAPAAPEQDSFAGKATEQWQSTRPGRGRDTAATRRAQMAGDQSSKPGGVRKMLRSASDACKRLAEAAAVSSRESRRQRSKSQAPRVTDVATISSSSRSRRPTQTGSTTVKSSSSTVGAGRLGSARGAATVGNTGSKVPGSVEIRMQQRAMRQFDKTTTRTGRTGRAVTARETPADKEKEGSVRGRGSVSARASTSVQRRTSSVQPVSVRHDITLPMI